MDCPAVVACRERFGTANSYATVRLWLPPTLGLRNPRPIDTATASSEKSGVPVSRTRKANMIKANEDITTSTSIPVVACSICSSTELRRYQLVREDTLARGSGRILLRRACRCQSCGYTWIVDPPSLAELSRAYRDQPADIWDPDAKARVGRFWPEKVRQLRALVPSGRVLDVGCYTGAFLEELGPCYDRWGIEPSSAAADVARARGVNVLQGMTHGASLPSGSFDVVLAFDVLEHVHDQSAFARQLASWLKPGGILVIETGDADSLHARFMGARWSYLALDEHIVAHSRRSLPLLMHEAGFRIVHAATQRHNLPITWRYQTKLFGRMLAHRCRTASIDVVRCLTGQKNFGQRQWMATGPFFLGYDHLWHIYRKD